MRARGEGSFLEHAYVAPSELATNPVQAELILHAAIAEHGSCAAAAEKPLPLLRAQLVFARALQALSHSHQHSHLH